MDFITGLPTSQRGHDSIWVIVDRLIKVVHFLPMRTDYTTGQYAQLFIAEIVRLHRVPLNIVSDRDKIFMSRFWESFQEAMDTELRLSSAYHPQTDGQTELTNQMLEDMLRICVLDFGGGWQPHLPLVEFAYNNSYQFTIGMAPFEALYGRPCRSPTCWLEVGDNKLLGPEVIQETSARIEMIRGRIRVAQDRQKSYADAKRFFIEINVGDQVLLRVSPMKGVMRFGKKGKLAPRYVGPFPIIERIGPVAYRLGFPEHLHRIHDVFHISSLRRYLRDDVAHTHIAIEEIDLQPSSSYEERPVAILDHSERRLRSKVVPLVRVQWGHHNVEESTWEREADMRKKYPDLFLPGMIFFFRISGRNSVIRGEVCNTLYFYAILIWGFIKFNVN